MLPVTELKRISKEFIEKYHPNKDVKAKGKTSIKGEAIHFDMESSISKSTDVVLKGMKKKKKLS